MAESGESRLPGAGLSGLLREWLARGELSRELGDRLWQALEAVVVAELRRRGLWSGSPRYLGFVGERWQEPGASRGGPLSELLSEVFVAAIAHPLPRWRVLLADPAANLEAALVKAIRHAIHELHRRHDRLGYALYQRAREAAEAALATGELRLAGGDPDKIGNGTLLAGGPATPASQPAPPEKLAAEVAGWLDELLPELVTGVKQKRKEVVRRLQRRLAGLAGQGIVLWRFKDLMDPLKSGVRARWQRRGQDDGELAAETDDEGLVRLVQIVPPRPLQRVELEHLEKLLECIATQLERHAAQQRTLEHAWSLWGYLGTHADPAADQERMPSARELERLLKIPREQIPGLLELLGRFLELCQKMLARLVKTPNFARGGLPR
jgi:hypothetical protein